MQIETYVVQSKDILNVKKGPFQKTSLLIRINQNTNVTTALKQIDVRNRIECMQRSRELFQTEEVRQSY